MLYLQPPKSDFLSNKKNKTRTKFLLCNKQFFRSLYALNEILILHDWNKSGMIYCLQLINTPARKAGQNIRQPCHSTHCPTLDSCFLYEIYNNLVISILFPPLQLGVTCVASNAQLKSK